MAKPPTVLDVVCECLQLIQELPPDQRELAITTLDHIKTWSTKALKCPQAAALAPGPGKQFCGRTSPLIEGPDDARVLTIRVGDTVSDSSLGMRFVELRIERGAFYDVASYYASRMTSGKIIVDGREMGETEMLACNVFGEAEVHERPVIDIVVEATP